MDHVNGEAQVHLSFMFNGLARVLKPGRAAVVHVCQIPRMKRSGGVGLCDFRGMNIRLGERAGLTYEYDWSVRKNPQAQAIRTRSRELQFAGLESDRAAQRLRSLRSSTAFRAYACRQSSYQIRGDR